MQVLIHWYWTELPSNEIEQDYIIYYGKRRTFPISMIIYKEAGPFLAEIESGLSDSILNLLIILPLCIHRPNHDTKKTIRLP